MHDDDDDDVFPNFSSSSSSSKTIPTLCTGTWVSNVNVKHGVHILGRVCLSLAQSLSVCVCVPLPCAKMSIHPPTLNIDQKFTEMIPHDNRQTETHPASITRASRK